MPGIFHRIFNGLARLRDVLSTYEHFDSRRLVTYADELGVTGLTCRTPGGEVLFKGLTFAVRRGESMLIMGPSGSGEACSLADYVRVVCALPRAPVT